MSSALGESSVLPIQGPVCKNPMGDRAGEKQESRRAGWFSRIKLGTSWKAAWQRKELRVLADS